MRLALLVALLAASAASAQKIRLSGGTSSGGGGALDPARNDTAASYTATGPNGLKTAPAASPGALGACAALSGGYASAVPVGETPPSPYFCGGVTWRRIWTDEEGLVASPDKSLPAFMFVSQAMVGGFAFKANNASIWDFGPGIDDECVSVGNVIECGSLRTKGGQSVSTDVLANTTGGANLSVSLARRLRIIPSGLAGCGTNDSGGLQTNSADGNRPNWCDGTTAYRISRVVEVPVTFDFPNVPNSSCVASSVTVTGAAASDTVTVTADFALPADVSVGQVRSTAANTVELRLCNSNASTAQDPASGSYRFRIER